MSVLVRNETDSDMIIFGRPPRHISPGSSEYISDLEWSAIISEKRGPGKLNPVSADPSITQKINLDYVLVGTIYETLYAGFANQSVLDTEPYWLIKKFSYVTLGTDNKITQIQVLDGVAWSDRATLTWDDD